MNQAVLMGMLRHALTIAAGGLVTAGYVDGDTANQIAGGHCRDCWRAVVSVGQAS
mgnify:CR=1 FL=1